MDLRRLEYGVDKPHIFCRGNRIGPYWWAVYRGRIIAGSRDPRKLALTRLWPDR
jgi:hypothetical protein